MARNSQQQIDKIVDEFRLLALPHPPDLKALAKRWGVKSIEERDIGSDAMLLPSGSGYSIILKKASLGILVRRQRFSLAHELGHLLLQKSEKTGATLKYRGHGYSDDEERLCDQIAAEILMPRMVFYEDGWMEDWSLRGLRSLSDKYETSHEATAIRMVDLMPEEALMGIWKLSQVEGKVSLGWSHRGNTSYGVPSTQILAKERLELIGRAWNSSQVETGVAPVKLGRRNPVDVPAEAMGWGRGENRKVMVFYYPTRQPSPSPV